MPTLGDRTDVVRLRLGDEDVAIYGQYQVRASVLEQPAAFSMQLGWSKVARELVTKYPPHTPFGLIIGTRLIQTGWTDAIDVQVGGGGTTVEIRGRDALAPLYDGYVDADTSFSEKSYLELTRRALEKVGLGNQDIIATN